MSGGRLWRRSVALPGDHGSWVFLLSPLLIGLFAGGRWSTVSLYLVVAALCGFLLRQPITILVKVRAGRRGRADRPAAMLWTAIYAVIGALHVAGLTLRGFGYLLYLALPGVPVFAWYLHLVARRSERRQRGVELLATAVLSLAATAAYWVGVEGPAPAGWLLGLLVWLQTAASILYAYLRLEQRTLDRRPTLGARLRHGAPAWGLTTANLVAVAALGLTGVVSRGLFLAYAVQCAEAWRGTLRPAIGLRPRRIGLRQLAVSSLFTLLFILLWR